MERLDKFMSLLARLCLFYALFSLGIFVAYNRLPPSGLYYKAFAALDAQLIRHVLPLFYHYETFSEEEFSKKVTIKNHAPERSWGHYTLFTVPTLPMALLIDKKGKIIHKWHLPYQNAGITSAEDAGCKAKYISWSRVRLFSDGRLLAMYHCNNAASSGHGLVMLDKNSQVIWASAVAAHHDMQLLANGGIVTFSNRIKKEPFPEAAFLGAPLIADSIDYLDNKGKLQRSIPLIPAFMDTPYEYILKRLTQDKYNDYLHPNSLQILTPELAQPMLSWKAGQILISIRNIDTLAVIDPITKKVVWAMQGRWSKQHEARMQPDGHIMLFDNMGYFDTDTNRNYSRIISVDPQTGTIRNLFAGNRKNRFFSNIRGNQQTLPNGNILINQSMGARILEVTAEGKIVWEFRYPYQHAPNQMNPLVTALRYHKDQLNFIPN